MNDLRTALALAVRLLERHEPTDSRAVSDEFVALAAISCGVDDQDHWNIINSALAEA